MSELTEEEIQSLYIWIDSIPLSKPKKNIHRDFADAVLTAEVVKHFIPKLVDLHNYSSASSLAQRSANWNTLNRKVFRKLGYIVPDEIIKEVIKGRPGYIEHILFALRERIDVYLTSVGSQYAINKSLQSLRSQLMQDDFIQTDPSNLKQIQDEYGRVSDSMELVSTTSVETEKDEVIKELKKTVEMLHIKMEKLEKLLELKEKKITELTSLISSSSSSTKKTITNSTIDTQNKSKSLSLSSPSSSSKPLTSRESDKDQPKRKPPRTMPLLK